MNIMNNDYIIRFDESGEPYIAHAWGQRGPNQSHKYIAKIGEGVKARYFYTQEELRAFQQGGRQKAQNAVNQAKEKAGDVVGRVRENSTLLNLGNQYRAAQRAHQNSKSSDPETAKWGKKGYDDNNTLGGKAYKVQQKATETVKSTAQKLNEKTKSASDKMREEFRKTKEAAANAKDVVKSLKEQVKDIIPGAKVSGNKLVMPSGNKITIPEQYIKELVIPETFLEEAVLREEVLTDELKRKKK